jgi:hypothetical protein
MSCPVHLLHALRNLFLSESWSTTIVFVVWNKVVLCTSSWEHDCSPQETVIILVMNWRIMVKNVFKTVHVSLVLLLLNSSHRAVRQPNSSAENTLLTKHLMDTNSTYESLWQCCRYSRTKLRHLPDKVLVPYAKIWSQNDFWWRHENKNEFCLPWYRPLPSISFLFPSYFSVFLYSVSSGVVFLSFRFIDDLYLNNFLSPIVLHVPETLTTYTCT